MFHPALLTLISCMFGILSSAPNSNAFCSWAVVQSFIWHSNYNPLCCVLGLMFSNSSGTYSFNPLLVWCSQAHVPLLHLAHMCAGPGWLHDHVLPDQPHLHLRRSGPDAGSHHPAAHPLPALHLGVHLAGLDLPPGKREMSGGGGGGSWWGCFLPSA